jgi:hypothetical protein
MLRPVIVPLLVLITGLFAALMKTMHQHIRRSDFEHVASDGQNNSLENENDNGRFPTTKQANASAPERMRIDKNAIGHG